MYIIHRTYVSKPRRRQEMVNTTAPQPIATSIIASMFRMYYLKLTVMKFMSVTHAEYWGFTGRPQRCIIIYKVNIVADEY